MLVSLVVAAVFAVPEDAAVVVFWSVAWADPGAAEPSAAETVAAALRAAPFSLISTV
jgi:hypothetical protein